MKIMLAKNLIWILLSTKWLERFLLICMPFYKNWTCFGSFSFPPILLIIRSNWEFFCTCTSTNSKILKSSSIYYLKSLTKYWILIFTLYEKIISVWYVKILICESSAVGKTIKFFILKKCLFYKNGFSCFSSRILPCIAFSFSAC